MTTLLAVIPKARRHGLRLLVTPDTILRWHRDIVRCRWAAKFTRSKTGRSASRRNIKALVLRPCSYESHCRWCQARRTRLPHVLVGVTRMKCAGTPSIHGSSPAPMTGARSASVSR